MFIREETFQDYDAVHAINCAAFGQPMEADIVKALRANCRDTLSLVAQIEERVVGDIFFSPVTIESDRGTVIGMGLAPMAVHPDHQRRGVGSALVAAGVGRLAKNGCPYIVVLGHPLYYPRFGFEPASRHGIHCPWEVPDEAFMIRILDEGRMEGVRGAAVYRPEFDAAM